MLLLLQLLLLLLQLITTQYVWFIQHPKFFQRFKKSFNYLKCNKRPTTLLYSIHISGKN